MKNKVKILKIIQENKDTKTFVVEKPEGFIFTPGHSIMLSINKPEWEYEKRPFSFASSTYEPHLEFIVKVYPEQNNVSLMMHSLKEGDELLLGEPFGNLRYTSPGIFIAAGVGIAPFFSIFRTLNRENKIQGNKLIWSVKKKEDLFKEDELKEMFNNNLNIIFSQESEDINKKIDKELLKSFIDDYEMPVYICGPTIFIQNIRKIINELKLEKENSVSL